MPLHIMGAVTTLARQNSSHMGNWLMLHRLIHSPALLSREPPLSHEVILLLCLFFSRFPFSNLICCRVILSLFFSFSTHRLAIYCIVSIATSKSSSPGSVMQIALNCIGYVVSSDWLCILGTGKDMKASRHRLAKRTAALAFEDRGKPQIITGRSLCK